MATTTPDNIFSPDGTSPDKTVVWTKAMADSVQAALKEMRIAFSQPSITVVPRVQENLDAGWFFSKWAVPPGNVTPTPEYPFSPGANGVTVTKTGRYSIAAMLQVSNATGFLVSRLVKNSSGADANTLGFATGSPVTGFGTFLNVSVPSVKLDAGTLIGWYSGTGTGYTFGAGGNGTSVSAGFLSVTLLPPSGFGQ